MKAALIINVLLHWNCLVPVRGLKECTKISACSCSTDAGIIDLAKGKSRFVGVTNVPIVLVLRK